MKMPSDDPTRYFELSKICCKKLWLTHIKNVENRTKNTIRCNMKTEMQNTKTMQKIILKRPFLKVHLL